MGIKVEMIEGAEAKPQEVAQKPADVVAEVKQTEEPKYVKIEDLDKINQAINNTRDYNNRKLSEINEKLERLIPKQAETKPDDLDEIVQKDWKLGVREVARQMIEEDRKKASVVTEEQRTANILEESKTKVMSRHPELSDPENPKTKEFLKVLDENPDFKSNPRGPLLAAYEMEQRIKSHDTIESRETKVDKTTRARATSVPAGTSTSSGGTRVLSKAQMDFCRHNNINPEVYKKNLGLTEART